MLRAGALVFVGAALSAAGASYVSSAGGLSDAFLRELVARMGSGLADPPGTTWTFLLKAWRPPGGGNGPARHEGAARPSPAPGLRRPGPQSLAQGPGVLVALVAPRHRARQLRGQEQAEAEEQPGGPQEHHRRRPARLLQPPNPCPIGYTAADGCLEDFENSAGFSRDYQALQDCMCDTEHMFECADSTRESEITALARSIQNEGVLDSTLDKIMDGLNFNPYLQGEKLPIAAKKGGGL
nr:uncharacterized protein LOC113829197 isoform X2 [Penaeus vannamei]